MIIPGPAPGVLLRPSDRPTSAAPPLSQALQVITHKLGVARA